MAENLDLDVAERIARREKCPNQLALIARIRELEGINDELLRCAQHAGEAEERAAFEKWLKKQYPTAPLHRRDRAASERIGEYCAPFVEEQWTAWQARAAAPQPAAVPEGIAVTTAQAAMLRSLLLAIRPEYGAPGTRDVDVSRQQKRIGAALAILDQAAAPVAAAPQPREWDASATTTAGERS